MAWNKLDSGLIRPGQQLTIWTQQIARNPSKPIRLSVNGGATHIAQQGETLWGIARRFKVSVESLKRWNSIDRALIKPGQILVVSEEQTDRKYTVVTGDTLYSIARKFGLQVEEAGAEKQHCADNDPIDGHDPKNPRKSRPIMHIARYILLLGLAFVIQTTWLDFFSVSNLKPDLILLIITIVALREGPILATLLGFIIGLLQDAYAPADLGLNALLKCTAGFAVGHGRSRVVSDNVQVQVALIFFTVLLHDLLYYAITSAISLFDAPYFWMRYGLGRAVYTGLVGAFAYVLFPLRQRLIRP